MTGGILEDARALTVLPRRRLLDDLVHGMGGVRDFGPGRGLGRRVDLAAYGDRSQIVVSMDAEPDGIKEKAADVAGLAGRQVKADLERFKELIEGRGRESGAWRGEVDRRAG